MPLPRLFTFLALLALCAWPAPPAPAVTVTIDYRFDEMGNDFFGSGNPQGAAGGAQARATLEAAADFFSDILGDTLEAIETPPDFVGNNGRVTWRWTGEFKHPETDFDWTIVDETIAEDEYLIFVGARGLAGNPVGSGGPGFVKAVQGLTSGGFTQDEVDQIEQIFAEFSDTAIRRGEPTGFVSWGGAFAVDNDPTLNWNFDHLTAPSGNQVDLLSVGLHEIAHVLGFGQIFIGDTSEWESLVSGTTFIGPAATAEYGGPVPLVSLSDRSHWRNGTASNVYGGTANQEAAMDPSLFNGSRKLVTELDAAALADIGWELVPLPTPDPLPGDYNGNGIVDAADYTVWRDTLGQTGPDLAANGDNGGASFNTIDQADYLFWKSRFGNSGSGAGAVLSGTASGSLVSGVPEPSAIALLLLGTLFAAARSRRN